jgi:hypothetical protein
LSYDYDIASYLVTSSDGKLVYISASEVLRSDASVDLKPALGPAGEDPLARRPDKGLK